MTTGAGIGNAGRGERFLAVEACTERDARLDASPAQDVVRAIA